MKTMIRILLADDDELVRISLRRWMAMQKDMEVVAEAEDGDQAVSLAFRIEPNVIVMDVMMPGISGIQAIEQIRGRGLATPVVVLTQDEDSRDRVTHLENVQFLLKAEAGATEVIKAIRSLSGEAR